MLVMNYLADFLPLNNKTKREISDSYPNLFVPAAITFTIWGIIYLLLAFYCIIPFTWRYQFIISDISWLFAVSCILNSLWILAWHYEKLPLSLLIMIGILVTLVYINIFIKELPLGLIKAAFGIYLGWICIATIANLTALLVYYKKNVFGTSDETWTIMMIVIATLIISLTLYKLDNPFIGVSVIWAFTGIILKRWADYRSIVITAAVAVLIVGILTFWLFYLKMTG